MALTYDEALASPNPRVGIFFRLEIDPVFRLWLGIGDCEAGIDATDGSGATYSGLGEIINVPAFQQLINGAADRVSFALNFVSQEVAALASRDANEVKGVTLMMGFGLFDGDWQLIADPTWLRRFTVDYLTVSKEATAGDAVWSLSLQARSFLTGRRRPGLSYFTDADQKARYPTDRFCERASLYSADVVKTWPKFS